MLLETSAQAIPSTVVPGFSATLNVSVTSSEDTALLILLKITDASAATAYETTIDDIAVSAGALRTVPFVWRVPEGQLEGTYTVSLGIFGAHWSNGSASRACQHPST